MNATTTTYTVGCEAGDWCGRDHTLTQCRYLTPGCDCETNRDGTTTYHCPEHAHLAEGDAPVWPWESTELPDPDDDDTTLADLHGARR